MRVLVLWIWRNENRIGIWFVEMGICLLVLMLILAIHTFNFHTKIC